MNYCPNCGTKLHNNAKFCAECGEALSVQTANNPSSNNHKPQISNNSIINSITEVYRKHASGWVIDKNAPGRKLILIPSIIWLVGSFIVGRLMNGESTLFSLGGETYSLEYAYNLGYTLFSLFLLYVFGMGIIFRNNLSKAELLQKIGMAAIIGYGVIAVWHLFINQFNAFGWFSFFGYLLEAVCPLLYYIGAKKNVEAYAYRFNNTHTPYNAETHIKPFSNDNNSTVSDERNNCTNNKDVDNSAPACIDDIMQNLAAGNIMAVIAFTDVYLKGTKEEQDTNCKRLLMIADKWDSKIQDNIAEHIALKFDWTDNEIARIGKEILSILAAVGNVKAQSVFSQQCKGDEGCTNNTIDEMSKDTLGINATIIETPVAKKPTQKSKRLAHVLIFSVLTIGIIFVIYTTSSTLFTCQAVVNDGIGLVGSNYRCGEPTAHTSKYCTTHTCRAEDCNNRNQWAGSGINFNAFNDYCSSECANRQSTVPSTAPFDYPVEPTESPIIQYNSDLGFHYIDFGNGSFTFRLLGVYNAEPWDYNTKQPGGHNLYYVERADAMDSEYKLVGYTSDEANPTVTQNTDDLILGNTYFYRISAMIDREIYYGHPLEVRCPDDIPQTPPPVEPEYGEPDDWFPEPPHELDSFWNPASDFRYEIREGTAGSELHIEGYGGSSPNVRIPETIEGIPVTTIGNQAFRGSVITEVYIPDSVVLIDDLAFAENEWLTTVRMSGNIELIDTGAFWECANLREINFPDSLIWVDYSAFYNCVSLSNVTFKGNTYSVEKHINNGWESDLPFEDEFYELPLEFYIAVVDNRFGGDGWRENKDIQDIIELYQLLF